MPDDWLEAVAIAEDCSRCRAADESWNLTAATRISRLRSSTHSCSSMVALVICITIHEFAHAYSAYRAGDDTPKAQGRISLNPLDHLDPMGTIMMVVSSLSGFGIGWGKPVQINPYNFRHPRWDNLRVSLWGPLSNLHHGGGRGNGACGSAGNAMPANLALMFMVAAGR